MGGSGSKEKEQTAPPKHEEIVVQDVDQERSRNQITQVPTVQQIEKEPFKIREETAVQPKQEEAKEPKEQKQSFEEKKESVLVEDKPKPEEAPFKGVESPKTVQNLDKSLKRSPTTSPKRAERTSNSPKRSNSKSPAVTRPMEENKKLVEQQVKKSNSPKHDKKKKRKDVSPVKSKEPLLEVKMADLAKSSPSLKNLPKVEEKYDRIDISPRIASSKARMPTAEEIEYKEYQGPLPKQVQINPTFQYRSIRSFKTAVEKVEDIESRLNSGQKSWKVDRMTTHSRLVSELETPRSTMRREASKTLLSTRKSNMNAKVLEYSKRMFQSTAGKMKRVSQSGRSLKAQSVNQLPKEQQIKAQVIDFGFRSRNFCATEDEESERQTVLRPLSKAKRFEGYVVVLRITKVGFHEQERMALFNSTRLPPTSGAKEASAKKRVKMTEEAESVASPKMQRSEVVQKQLERIAAKVRSA